MKLADPLRVILGIFSSKDLATYYKDITEILDQPEQPKVLQTWRKTKFDSNHANTILRCMKLNNESRFFLFGDRDINKFMVDHFSGHPILEIFQDAQHMVAKTDIWRICALYTFGGMYLDIDSTITFNVAQIAPKTTEIVSYSQEPLSKYIDENIFPEDVYFRENKSKVEGKLLHPKNLMINWCMYFVKKHRMLEIAINDICENAKKNYEVTFPDVRQAILHLAGPIVLTRAAWKYVIEGHCLDQRTFDFDDKAIFRAVRRESTFFVGSRYDSQTNMKILRSGI